MSVTHQMKEFLFSSLFTTILAIHPTISMQQRLRLIYVVQHMKKKTTALILEFFLSFDSLIFVAFLFFVLSLFFWLAIPRMCVHSRRARHSNRLSLATASTTYLSSSSCSLIGWNASRRSVRSYCARHFAASGLPSALYPSLSLSIVSISIKVLLLLYISRDEIYYCISLS